MSKAARCADKQYCPGMLTRKSIHVAGLSSLPPNYAFDHGMHQTHKTQSMIAPNAMHCAKPRYNAAMNAVDLNLLTALDVLLTERSVTSAARLSASALPL